MEVNGIIYYYACFVWGEKTLKHQMFSVVTSLSSLTTESACNLLWEAWWLVIGMSHLSANSFRKAVFSFKLTLSAQLTRKLIIRFLFYMQTCVTLTFIQTCTIGLYMCLWYWCLLVCICSLCVYIRFTEVCIHITVVMWKRDNFGDFSWFNSS